MSDAESEKRIFLDQIGQKARIQRHEKSDGPAKHAAHGLLEIGQFLGEQDAGVRNCKYMGSCAVHVYQSEVLGEIFFFTQTQTLCSMPEVTASHAMSQLMKDAMKYYGRKPPEKRSGW